MITKGCKVKRKPEYLNYYWKEWCHSNGVAADAKLTVDYYNQGLGTLGLSLDNGQGTWFDRYFFVCTEEETHPVVQQPKPVPVPEHDMVKKPKHYAFFDEVESIQVIASSMTKEEFRGFCFGNQLKYRMRAGKKDNVEQELNKSDFYIELFNQHKDLCRTSSLFGA